MQTYSNGFFFWNQAQKYREAGKLLVLLLTSNAAPKTFWPILLIDSIALLEGMCLVLYVHMQFTLVVVSPAFLINPNKKIFSS